MKNFLILLLMIFSAKGVLAETCAQLKDRPDRKIGKTPVGDLVFRYCGSKKETALIDGVSYYYGESNFSPTGGLIGPQQNIFAQNYIYKKINGDRVNQYYVFTTGELNNNTRCGDYVVFADFTGNSPRFFNVGVKNACNNLQGLSLRKDGRVRIAIEKNIVFYYKDGKFTLPSKDEYLLSGCMPSDFMVNGCDLDKLQPFAVEKTIKN